MCSNFPFTYSDTITSIQYPNRPLLRMASLRALNLVRTNGRGGLSTPGKVVLLNALTKPQRRHASFYNADIAGLSEEEAEVFIYLCVVSQGFVNDSRHLSSGLW